MTNPLTHAGPNLERASSSQKIYVFKASCNMLLCFCPVSTLNLFPMQSGEPRIGLLRRPVNLQIRTRQPWSLKSSANETALLPLEMKRATLPFWPYAPVSEEPTRCCEDLSCKSLKPRRIMPLIFGNRFPWEISQGISRQLCAFQLNLPARRCTYQGSGDRDVFP